jgi:MazG family protein
MPAPTPEDRAAGERFAELVAIIRQLRGPDGCPWDREQDFASLRRFTLEEAYEVVQAIDDGDRAALADELGDLLLQVVFLSQMADEEGSFCVGDTVDAITAKLIRRHPHVFAGVEVADADEVRRSWEKIKHDERAVSGKGTASLMDDVPRSLPALERAQKLGQRAAQLDFDWPDTAGVVAKVREEFDELEVAALAGSRSRTEAELGDLFLALTSLARHLGVSAEVATNGAAARFESRFRQVETAVRDGRVAPDAAGMESAWRQAKRDERAVGGEADGEGS